MGMSGGQLDGDPMIDMNMTPLIDVLLVLLIMFIITIPVAIHSVDIDLPSPPDPNQPEPPVDPIKNKVVLSADDVIYWNGQSVDSGTLRGLLERTKGIEPEPELQYEPEALASYDLSVRVVQLIKESEVNKFGFVGNDKYRTFSKGPE